MLVPAGRILGPAGRLLIPADRILGPADCMLGPADCLLIPADRILGPATRQVIRAPPARRLLCSPATLGLPRFLTARGPVRPRTGDAPAATRRRAAGRQRT